MFDVAEKINKLNLDYLNRVRDIISEPEVKKAEMEADEEFLTLKQILEKPQIELGFYFRMIIRRSYA